MQCPNQPAGPMARSLYQEHLTGDFGTLEPIPDYRRITPGSDAANGLLKHYRPEFYARNALLIDSAAKRSLAARALRPPYGLIAADFGHVDANGPTTRVVTSLDRGRYSDLLEALLYTGTTDTNDLLAEAGSDPVQASSISRLDDLRELFNRLALVDGYSLENYHSIQRGLSLGRETGFSMMLKGLEVIPQVIVRDRPLIPEDEVVPIARASSRLLTKPATINFDVLYPLVRAIDVPPFSPARTVIHRRFGQIDPSLLELKTPPDEQPYVDYIASMGDQVDPASGKKIDELPKRFETIGCPALIFLMGTTAIASYWQWIVDIGEQIGTFRLGY